jgi:hypothetical protein
MASAIDGRQQIRQRQHDDQNQQQLSDNAQIYCFWLSPGTPNGPDLGDIPMIIQGFSSPFKATALSATELTKALP